MMPDSPKLFRCNEWSIMLEPDRKLTAYQLYPETAMWLTPAPLERDWMDSANARFPYRCLPLNIANQHGWFIACPVDFEAYWYGTLQAQDIELRFDGPAEQTISSHFGYGVLTFSMPYLFRTPPGMNLWVKGPSNMPKDGIQPLEGIVETDWATSTFTMNWKFTRPFEWIRFKAGEPICMVVPIPRGLIESLEPAVEFIASDPELNAKYTEWARGRSNFLSELQSLKPEAVQRGWQKEYFLGKTGEGTFAGHQTRLDVKEFPPLRGPIDAA
jgi:hypothetical protein